MNTLFSRSNKNIGNKKDNIDAKYFFLNHTHEKFFKINENQVLTWES